MLRKSLRRVFAAAVSLGVGAAASEGWAAEPRYTPCDPWARANPKAYAKAQVPALKGGPSAHAPHFDDLELWPEPDGTPAYKKQKWPKARLLVWKRVDAPRDFRANPWDLDNWVEDGKPATAPPDEETDLLFPASEKPYHVLAGRLCPWHWRMVARHVTIEKGCELNVDGSEIHGNLWVKDGAKVNLDMGGSVAGKGHTFMRCDIPVGWRPGAAVRPWEATDEDLPYATIITHYFWFNKHQDASAEAVGNWGCWDKFGVNSGTLIIGPDSYVGCGTRGESYIRKGAAVQLQSGAAYSRLKSCNVGIDIYCEGRIRAGSPERPISRDCTLGLGWKARVDGLPEGESGGIGLVLRPEGDLRVYTREPAKARLRIQWMGTSQWSVGPPFIWRHKPLKPTDRGYDMDRRWREAFARKLIQPYIELSLQRDLDLSNVAFDDVRRHGIRLVELDNRKRWNNVSFGERNEARPDDLFAYTPVSGGWECKPVRISPVVRDERQTFGEPFQVKLECQEKSIELRYTIDGTEPTTGSARYDGPFTVSRSVTVKAAAFKNGLPFGWPSRAIYRFAQ